MAAAGGLNFRREWHRLSILVKIINTKYVLYVTRKVGFPAVDVRRADTEIHQNLLKYPNI